MQTQLKINGSIELPQKQEKKIWKKLGRMKFEWSKGGEKKKEKFSDFLQLPEDEEEGEGEEGFK